MSVQRIARRSVAGVSPDPVEFWLSRLDLDTRTANRSHFNRWMRWLRTQPGWETVTPRQLLIHELESQDPYAVLDLLQAYVDSLVLIE